MQGEVVVSHAEEILICDFSWLIVWVTAIILGTAFLFLWESSIERAISAEEDRLQPVAFVEHSTHISVVQT